MTPLGGQANKVLQRTKADARAARSLWPSPLNTDTVGRTTFGVRDNMTTVHLVCGFLGSGKTTFSKSLARDTSAVRLSVDEWYLRLFTDGVPTYEVDAEALARVLAALNDLWLQVAMAGVDVVLDFGFWNRTLRDEVRERARAIGVATRLYWLRCPDEIACARCLERNDAPGAFLISEEDPKIRTSG